MTPEVAEPLTCRWQYGRLVPMPEAIPSGWHFVRLTEVARLESGHTPSRKHPEYWAGDIPWVSLHDSKVLDQPEIRRTAQTIGELGLANSSARLLPQGTVVFSRTATVGKATILGSEMATSQDFANYVCGPRLWNRYLLQLLRFLQPEWKRLMAGSTHNTIYMPVFENLQALLPPLGEQRKIAAILSSVDEAIEATQAVIDQLQVVKKAMMAELLTRGLPGRHTRFKMTEIGKLPEDWQVVRIVEVADVDYGISAAVSKNTNPSIGWPIITGANLTLGGGLDLSEVVYHPPPRSPQHLLHPGDLLLNWRSGSAAHVGKTAFFDRSENYTYASFVLRIRSRGPLLPRFGHVLLNFMREQEYFSRDLSQQVNFKMNAAVFRGVPIRLPSLAEQETIADACTAVDGLLTGNREQLAQIGRLKNALMSILLTGEVRVKPDEEPT